MAKGKNDEQINLLFENKNVWEASTKKFIKSAHQFCEEYKNFMNNAKTEREFVNKTIEEARINGFINFDNVIKDNIKLEPGSKIYKVIRNKSIILAIIGSDSIEYGTNIIGSHIDSPRIDLKQKPLYEDTELALLKTQYYGGIKKYQWVTIPLALHGVIFKEDGSSVEILIGEDDNDPVFCITDLLPHLSKNQLNKKLNEGITGEDLNILFGSTINKTKEDGKDKVKTSILNLLYEKYNIQEEDFISAELEIVPAFKSRDVGIDRSLVGAYGQDDRVCSYAAIKAIFELENVERTSICYLSDKEETGSSGNTGAESNLFEYFISELCNSISENYSDLVTKRCLNNSKMLSGDVTPAVDPTFKDVNDIKNAAFLGKGIVIEKYTGSRGKAGTSDANPEFIAKVRNIFNKNNIRWQSAAIGKVDLGGGGTIAMFFAKLGIEVLDCGISILSMHAPYEITSKVDIFEMFNAYKFFYSDMT